MLIGSAITDPRSPTRGSYQALPQSRGHRFEWHPFTHGAVLTMWNDCDGTQLIARKTGSLAAGIVRLDNRAEMLRLLGPQHEALSDLELVLHLVSRYGAKHIRSMLGDFAFAVWNAETATVIAACDAMGARRLYISSGAEAIAVASRAEVLANGKPYDVQYLSEAVAQCSPDPEATVYAGVRRLPEGTVAFVENGSMTRRQYWSAEDIEIERGWVRAERELAWECRRLLTEAVLARLGPRGETWAQLSGGMDSSAVVSLAQALAEEGRSTCGLAGTVTFAEPRCSAADERAFSDAVVRRWGVRNEQIVDFPLWADARYSLPLTDEPGVDYPFHPRDQHLCRIIRDAGGRALLTGVGGDELFGGYMYFFADWMVEGRVRQAIKEMLHRAAVGRVSFWEIAYRHGLLPMLPAFLQRRLLREGGGVPPWLLGTMVRRYNLKKATHVARVHEGRMGRKYHHAVRATFVGLCRGLRPGVLGDQLDVRHPFLHRPLVEFALRLPPELCSRPNQRKWLLRQALRGVLPEAVRTRVGKGSPADIYAWSFMAVRPLLEPLVRDSMLADLGIIDPVKLRSALDAAPQKAHSIELPHAALYATLALEAWLQARSGRWPRRAACSTSVSSHQIVGAPALGATSGGIV